MSPQLDSHRAKVPKPSLLHSCCLRPITHCPPFDDEHIPWDTLAKVSDESGHTYKFKASAEKLEGVLVAVADKLKKPKDAILLKYADDDGDQIVLSGWVTKHSCAFRCLASVDWSVVSRGSRRVARSVRACPVCRILSGL